MPEAKTTRTRLEHANPILNVANVLRLVSDPRKDLGDRTS